ncbi:MAG: PIN domain-containing protein [Pyrinomonadaceae bacterium]
MSALVADTHTLIWYLNNSTRLSANAYTVLAAAEQAGDAIYIPAIVIIELRYLVEKGTITETDYQNILKEIKDPTTVLTIAALDLTTADILSQIPRSTVPDMPDRIIAATAFALNLPLVTCDTKIGKLSNISTVW